MNGIVVFEIFPNGCLNGVYSNDHLDTKNEIFNEIARKISGEESDEILGVYACSYIDVGNIVKNCVLVISNPLLRKPPRVRKGQYDFTWYRDYNPKTKKGNIIFEGTGWRTRENQITVSYRDI